jgi:hypothetical protein
VEEALRFQPWVLKVFENAAPQAERERRSTKRLFLARVGRVPSRSPRSFRANPSVDREVAGAQMTAHTIKNRSLTRYCQRSGPGGECTQVQLLDYNKRKTPPRRVPRRRTTRPSGSEKTKGKNSHSFNQVVEQQPR